ncbi:MAG: L-serine ammonia-lyase [Vulcanimicrobiota bacterium]
MDSLKELFKAGMGPSSSHTMGPHKAAEQFGKLYPEAHSYRVTLYGSLAATGKGHLTDKALTDALSPHAVEIVWKSEITLPLHPNGMDFEALSTDGEAAGRWRVYSVGGGTLKEEGISEKTGDPVYTLSSMKSILSYMLEKGISFWEFVDHNDHGDIREYLNGIWQTMKSTIKRGLHSEGVLPGGLNLPRKAISYYIKAQTSSGYIRQVNLLFAYALACSEENASGGTVVTAPTCGSCGIIPSVLYFFHKEHDVPEIRIVNALATAGIIGNLAKVNASISGAEVGCQGEVGVACAMAAGAVAYLLGETPNQIEYAAEMAIEHHLGLTCDPVEGLVQIPCIERNGMSALQAINSAMFCMSSDGRHKISYDEVLKVMLDTGRDLKDTYRETAKGGLAGRM